MLVTSTHTTFQKHSKTSYFHVSSSLLLKYEVAMNFKEQGMSTSELASILKINCAVKLCTSVLFIENTDVEIKWKNDIMCYEKGELQIWNRSECQLCYQLTQSDTELGTCIFSYSISNEQMIATALRREFIVPPFASQILLISADTKEANKKFAFTKTRIDFNKIIRSGICWWGLYCASSKYS